MRITDNEELNLTEGQDIVFFLGHEFSLEGTNLFKIIPNIKGKSYVINQSGYDLKKLCSFYNIQTVFLDVDAQLIEKAVYLFIQVNDDDLVRIKSILDSSSKIKHHVLLNNPEYYYHFIEKLKKNTVVVHLPILFNHFPIHIEGVPKEENPFYYKDLFDIKIYIDLYWGSILEDKLNVRNTKGYLYKYLENIYKEKKNELETILNYKIPSKAIDLSIDKFNARPLTLKESIEKSILEGDYDKLPQLVENLINQDASQFNNIYEWIKYLECKAPNNVIQGILENTLKSDDVIIDNRFLPLVYEKLAITYQKEGDLNAAASCYRRFSNLENINGELKNISSNFLRKEVELLYMAGEFQAIIDIGVEEKLSILNREDAPSVALCLSLAHNELGNYEKATQFLKGDSEEKAFLRNIYKLNKAEISAHSIMKEVNFTKLSLYNDMLIAMALMKDGQYVDTIKVFNRMKEVLVNPQNLIARRVLLIVSLLKARALKYMGNIRESLIEYYNNLEAHSEDFEKDNRSLILEILYEIADLEKSMKNTRKSLDLIDKGLSIKRDETSVYENQAHIQLLLIKLEIINETGEDDKKLIEILDNILSDKKNMSEYKPLQVKMNNILVRAYVKNGRIREALDIIENSYNEYKEETDKNIEFDLLEMLEIAKEQYKATDVPETGMLQLKRIVDKYRDNKNTEIRIRRAFALKELADYMLSMGDDNGAMKEYKRLIEEYSGNKYKKLESILQDTMIKKGEISFKKGNYEEVRDSLMSIEGKLNSDTDASRELLLAKCSEKLGNRELAISGYEEYLIKIKDKNFFEDVKGPIYNALSKLLVSIGRKERAIEYLDKLLEVEFVPIGRLVALLDKSKLLYELDNDKGYLIYEYSIKTFKGETDNNILETLVNICSEIAVDIAKRDINLYSDYLKIALSKFKNLSKGTKAKIFESMRIAAEIYEKSNLLTDEKSMRTEIVKYFGDKETLDYQIESAYHYNRILEINIQENTIDDLDHSCADYKSFFIGKESDFAKDTCNQGLLMYGKEYLKRNDLKKAKKILKEILDFNNEMFLAKLYYGKTLTALGENKKALKAFNDIVEHDISGELFESVKEKIRLEKKEKSLFRGNMKKLIKEIEERILPVINAGENNENKIILIYELALLYKAIKNIDKYQELLRGLIEKYSKHEDENISENLKLVYKELE
ncbi:MAG: hypothetical protein PHQ32_07355 [Firmicutes bacterium]|nr:hypothetical protein [Bacillota bacterium]